MCLELPPSGVELVIRRRQGRIERLLVRDLGGEGGVLLWSASGGRYMGRAAPTHLELEVNSDLLHGARGREGRRWGLMREMCRGWRELTAG